MFKQKNKNKFKLENPISKRKIFQLEKGKHFQYELVNREMAEEQQQQ